MLELIVYLSSCHKVLTIAKSINGAVLGDSHKQRRGNQIFSDSMWKNYIFYYFRSCRYQSRLANVFIKIGILLIINFTYGSSLTLM